MRSLVGGLFNLLRVLTFQISCWSYSKREIRGKEGAVSNEKRKQLSIRDKLWQQYSQVRDNEKKKKKPQKLLFEDTPGDNYVFN